MNERLKLLYLLKRKTILCVILHVYGIHIHAYECTHQHLLFRYHIIPHNIFFYNHSFFLITIHGFILDLFFVCSSIQSVTRFCHFATKVFFKWSLPWFQDLELGLGKGGFYLLSKLLEITHPFFDCFQKQSF